VGGMRRDSTRSDCSTLVIERSSSSMWAALGRGILQPPGAALQDLAAQRPPTGARARERAVGQFDQKHRAPHGRCDTRGLCSSRTAATERPRKDAVAAASGSGPSTPRLSDYLVSDARMGPIPPRAGSAAHSADPCLRRTARAERQMHAGPGEPATRPWAAAITQPGVTAKSGLHDRSSTPHKHPTAMNPPTVMNPQAGITSSSGSVGDCEPSDRLTAGAGVAIAALVFGNTASSGAGFMLRYTTIDVAGRRRSGTGAGVPARRDFQALENRRTAAADMFARGKGQVDVVDKLGVSAQTASRWHPIFLAEGKKGLPNQRLGSPQSTGIDDCSSADAGGSIALPPRRLWLSAPVAIIAMAILALVGVSHRTTPTSAPTHRTAAVCARAADAKMPDALITHGDPGRLDASLIKLSDPSLLDPSLFTPGERCLSGYVPKQLQWLTSFSKAMHDANITTPDQQAAFLAQIAEETGGLRMVTERPWGLPRSQWNNEQAVRNYFNNKYANINGNGDVSSGDGYTYRGRGILQITGKSNYAAVSEKLYGDDRLLKNPDLLSQPDAACAAAAAYWNENDLNRFIPPGQPVTPQQFQNLGSTINTGHPGHVPNNEATRVKYWEVAKQALGAIYPNAGLSHPVGAES
jgi:putative chitinase